MSDWRAHAACKGMEPALFVSDAKGDRYPSVVFATCESCPVAGDCLEEALRTREPNGVWGGFTPRQWRTMRPGALVCVECHGEFAWAGHARRSKVCSPECGHVRRRRQQYEQAAQAKVGAA